MNQINIVMMISHDVIWYKDICVSYGVVRCNKIINSTVLCGSVEEFKRFIHHIIKWGYTNEYKICFKLMNNLNSDIVSWLWDNLGKKNGNPLTNFYYDKYFPDYAIPQENVMNHVRDKMEWAIYYHHRYFKSYRQFHNAYVKYRNSTMSDTDKSILYLLRMKNVNQETFLKFGITNDLDDRIKSLRYDKKYHDWHDIEIINNVSNVHARAIETVFKSYLFKDKIVFGTEYVEDTDVNQIFFYDYFRKLEAEEVQTGIFLEWLKSQRDYQASQALEFLGYHQLFDDVEYLDKEKALKNVEIVFSHCDEVLNG